MISGFLGRASVSGHGICGFNRGWSLVVNSRVKSLATPDQPKPDRKKLIF